MQYEHAVAVTVTVLTHVITDSEQRPADSTVIQRAAEIMRRWNADDVEAHMEDSGVEYVECLPVDEG